MAWGKGSTLSSCDAILRRVEANDAKLTDLVILPMKTFGVYEVERLGTAIASGANTNLHSISASGHHLPPDALKRFGLALSAQAKMILGSGKHSSSVNPNGITKLALGSKDMGDEGVVALCEGLKETNGGVIRHIDFGWKNIGKDGMAAIGETFAASNHLKSMDLSRNENVGDKGIASFAHAAKSGAHDVALFSSLEKLVLSECNIGHSGVSILVTEVMLNLTNPLDFSINSNPIGTVGCCHISELCAIPGKGSLFSHLNLSQCNIGNGGILALTDSTMNGEAHGLKALDLSENSITERGAEEFAKSMPKFWPHMVELKLAKNHLGEKGVKALTGALYKRHDTWPNDDIPSPDKDQLDCGNRTLNSLDLSGSNCGILGATCALMCGSLSTVRLFNNRLGSDGFRAISRYLRGGHPSIVNLDLGGNESEEEAVVALLDAIATKYDDDAVSKLAVLEIGGNKFGDVAMKALEQVKLVWPKLDVAHDKPTPAAQIDEIGQE